jgi:hypothetical protein
MKKSINGQSMTELAIIAPILLFFMIGIFEVGYALRNYLVLVNLNREAARFSIRPGYLDLRAISFEEVGYGDLVNHIIDAAGGQIKTDFGESMSLLVNVIEIDTGFPCDPELRVDGQWDEADCDCDLVGTNPYTSYITVNGLTDPRYYYSEPPGLESRFDIEALTKELAIKNNEFNCTAVKKGRLPSQEDVVIVEMIYQHEQLFGFPLISNPLMDPIELYTHTVMRKGGFRKSPYDSGTYE